MTKGLIGKKIGMTQIFDEAGKVVPVTVIEAGPCVVTQLKTAENDGYEAVILSCLELCYNARTCFDNGNRNYFSCFVENLSHSDFLSD